MESSTSSYQSPLAGRYASPEMLWNFSDDKKFTTWRALWIALAESEKELGLPITDEQLAQMRAHAKDIDYRAAAEHERRLRHDVMAHVHAFGDQCPAARAIIHLGATSCYVTDNTDLILLRDGVDILERELVSVIARLRDFAWRWRSLPALGFTHLQPAQATTVGKRACIWLQDLLDDHAELEHAREGIRFRGAKGATGTQASYLELLGGDHAKVRELEARVTARMGFARVFAVTGQTYPRKQDFRVLQVLSGLAQSAHKFASDLRLLASRRELEEPFEKEQIGSSAMPWKRNPMRAERMCSLSRFIIELLGNTAHTAANQWLERTLDDSANRRVVLAEAFLAADSVLNIYDNVAAGLVVYPEVIRRNLEEELPFLAAEHLLMEGVKAGGDRQTLHESLRRHSREAAKAVQEKAQANPMRALLAADPAFHAVKGKLDQLLDGSRYIGRAPEQVAEFLELEVDPLLARRAHLGLRPGEVRV